MIPDSELVESMVSVLMPTYNEPALPRVVASVRAEMERLGRPYEILIIDDASTLDSASEVACDQKVRVIRQPINGGYGASLKEGIRRAAGQFVLTMDSDDQHKPDSIADLLGDVDRGAEAALGCRTKRFHSRLWRMPGKWLLLGLARYLSRRRIPDINCGFRAFRTAKVRRYLGLCCERFSFSTTCALCCLLDGLKVTFVPTEVQHREGKSAVRPRDGFAALLSVLQIIMLFAPLRVLMPPSLLLLLAGTVSLVRDVIAINITQATILLLVGGLMFFFFGLLADQIAAIRRRLL